MKATVIIPTTGSPLVKQAIKSVLKQSIETQCYVVCDGQDYQNKTKSILDGFNDTMLKTAYLPINVGANGFYGHRIYAAFTHLINTDYVLYLDQDNWFEPNHVEKCIEVIEKYSLDWSYSLRNIADENGNILTQDNCESLGRWQTFQGIHHIDTNCYCLKTSVAIKLAQAWHGGWGQDRVFLGALTQHFQRYDCSKEYTVNYRVNGNPGSVKPEFFEIGNEAMMKKYNGELPWQKRT